MAFLGRGGDKLSSTSLFAKYVHASNDHSVTIAAISATLPTDSLTHTYTHEQQSGCRQHVLREDEQAHGLAVLRKQVVPRRRFAGASRCPASEHARAHSHAQKRQHNIISTLRCLHDKCPLCRVSSARRAVAMGDTQLFLGCREPT